MRAVPVRWVESCSAWKTADPRVRSFSHARPSLTAVCDLCKADLVYNKRSTTNLLRHLRLRHPFEFAAYEEKQLRPVSMRETPFTTTCIPDLHLKTHGPVVEPIAGASESSFEPVRLPNPPVASTSSTACALLCNKEAD